MDPKIKQGIIDILEGKASVEDAQYYLSQVDEKDLKGLMPEEDLNRLVAAYKERNQFQSEQLPYVSETEIDDIWKNIRSSGATASYFHQVLRTIKEKINYFFKSFSYTPFSKYGAAALALICLLVIVPIVIQNRHMGDDTYTGIKGDAVLPKVTFEYAVFSPEGRLVRPERPLLENDTIAFRVNTDTAGYCSIYVVNDGQVHGVVADHFLSAGSHDLDAGYSFAGSQGLNQVVMLYTDKPARVEQSDIQPLMLAALKNGETSIRIGENDILLVYQNINVLPGKKE